MKERLQPGRALKTGTLLILAWLAPLCLAAEAHHELSVVGTVAGGWTTRTVGSGEVENVRVHLVVQSEAQGHIRTFTFHCGTYKNAPEDGDPQVPTLAEECELLLGYPEPLELEFVGCFRRSGWGIDLLRIEAAE